MLKFDQRCGKKAEVVRGGSSAQRRIGTFCHGVVLTDRALRPGEMFEVELDETVLKLDGYIAIGITVHNFAHLRPDFTSTLSQIQSGVWFMEGTDIVHNGVIIVKQYGQDLHKLNGGDRVGVLCEPGGGLHFYVNGFDQGQAASGVPKGAHGILELYGQSVMVTIINHAGYGRTDRETLPYNVSPAQALSGIESFRETAYARKEDELHPYRTVLRSIHACSRQVSMETDSGKNIREKYGMKTWHTDIPRSVTQMRDDRSTKTSTGKGPIGSTVTAVSESWKNRRTPSLHTNRRGTSSSDPSQKAPSMDTKLPIREKRHEGNKTNTVNEPEEKGGSPENNILPGVSGIDEPVIEKSDVNEDIIGDFEELTIPSIPSCTEEFFNRVKLWSYDMTGPEKGRVLIVNMNERRDGCEVDKSRMKYLFEDLGYNVTMLDDPNCSEIDDTLQSFATSVENGKAKSIFVILMAHGGMNRRGDLFVWLRDRTPYLFQREFKDIFSNSNAPLLRHKPKVFIIQSCMGERLDEGTVDTNFGTPPCQIQMDSMELSEDEYPPLIPTISDCLFAFAAMPEYQASRHRIEGSIFLNEIDLVFRREAHRSHVCEMLTMVRENVEKGTGSRAAKLLWKERRTGQGVNKEPIFVQTTYNIDFLNKRFFLFPGL